MTSVHTTRPAEGAGRYRGLQRLGISAEQLAALTRQGFLAREDRGGAKPIYKLRFRFRGRQIVKYVGTEPMIVNALQQELRALQCEHHWARGLQRLAGEAHAELRRTKRQLQPLLKAAGMKFHGYVIRRSLEKND